LIVGLGPNLYLIALIAIKLTLIGLRSLNVLGSVTPHEGHCSRRGPGTSDASISLFRFRYDIETILTKYRDIDIDTVFCK